MCGLGIEGLGYVGEDEPCPGAATVELLASGYWGRVGEQSVDLACDVAFETAGDLAPGFVFSASLLGVFLGAFVVVLSSKAALRVLGWGEGVEYVPVGFTGVCIVRIR